MVDDDEQELLVGRHHDLMLLQLESDEGEVVVGVLGRNSKQLKNQEI